MPTPVKILFSIVVLAVAFTSSVFLVWLAQPVSSYLALFFGAFSVVSFWIFPEVVHNKSK
ncbi:MAG: hypothetical protein AAGB04_06880 [Pseudomonadota bacterium]